MNILENLSTEELVELKNLSKEEIEKEIKTRFPVSEPCYILTRPCPQEISLINITEVDNSKITYDFIFQRNELVFKFFITILFIWDIVACNNVHPIDTI